MHPHLLPLALLATLMLSACAASPPAAPSAPATATYTFVILKSGPTSGQGDKEARQQMFAGHMANINRLADERKLLMAGPFASPRDKAWRGLFLLDTDSLATAQEWVATDPGVVAGEFAPDLQLIRGCPSLRTTLALEDAAKARRTPDPAKPMQGMRRYTLATGADLSPILSAATRATIRVVWCGRSDQGGIAVLDAPDAAAASAKLGDGPWALDGWFAAESLMDLPPSAGKP
jgi:uncharacterized protein YciI